MPTENDLQSDANPYQPPFRESVESLRTERSSGLAWLLGGFGVMFFCVMVLGYLMLAEMPCIKKTYFERNLRIPVLLSIVEGVVIFTLNYWPLLLVFAITPWVLVERYCTLTRRRTCRKWLGASIGFLSLVLTFWVVWQALSAMDWRSLYFS